MEVKNTAGKLPFDILCMIFEQYAKLDDRFTPLETLLLVSKSWHNTALHATRLWSSFEMNIRSIGDLYYWNVCLTRRLNRCPPPVLLDICINITCNNQHRHKTWDTLLMQLTGESGEVAKRWRRFLLNDPYACIPDGVLKQRVSFPTPNLEEIRMNHFRVGDRLAFPDTPSLRIFHHSGRDIPKLPNLSNTTDLSIYVGGVWEEFNEQAIAKAINLVTMTIYSRASFKLTATYKQLRSLDLDGRLSEGSLSTFSAPILTNLMLALSEGKSFHHLVSCKGINPGTLRKVHIRDASFDFVEDEEIPEYLDGVHQLLTAAINLELLILEHTPIAHSILKQLVDDCQWLNQCHNLRIVLQDDRVEWDLDLRKEENRVANIDQLMKEMGCVDECARLEFGYCTMEDPPPRVLSLWGRF